MINKKKRSPLFYVGDKYKLMPQLINLFPDNIANYYEPFVGGGSSFLYVEANKYIVNDLNKYIIRLHKYLQKYSDSPEKLFKKLYKIINSYGLSCSAINDIVPKELKDEYVKTYYSKFNKEQYLKMRNDFNQNKKIELLYLLLIYGFNHMIRFNSLNEFNLPVGNVDFNSNVVNAIENYLDFTKNKEFEFFAKDYKKFLSQMEFEENDYIYIDPPYLISNSEYNKLWNEKKEKELYEFIDALNDRNIMFGISNVIEHKGQENIILKKWMEKYKVYEIESNYISRFDNTIKKDSKEVFITNYEKSRI